MSLLATNSTNLESRPAPMSIGLLPPCHSSVDGVPGTHREVLREARPIGRGYSIGTTTVPLVKLCSLICRQIINTFQHLAVPLIDAAVVNVHYFRVVKVVGHSNLCTILMLSMEDAWGLSNHFAPVLRQAFVPLQLLQRLELNDSTFQEQGGRRLQRYEFFAQSLS